MSKVILTINKGHGRKELVSLKCKDEKRASEIANSRPNCIRWEFYPDGAIIPRPKKKVKKDDSIYAKIQSGEINMENIDQFLR